MNNYCDFCLWECKGEDPEGCPHFSPTIDIYDVADPAYGEYIKEGYDEFMISCGYHPDDEWFKDPQ